MAKVLRCPNCGHVHPLSTVPAAQFPCEQCGQELKVPAPFNEGLPPTPGAPVPAPPRAEPAAARPAAAPEPAPVSRPATAAVAAAAGGAAAATAATAAGAMPAAPPLTANPPVGARSVTSSSGRGPRPAEPTDTTRAQPPVGATPPPTAAASTAAAAAAAAEPKPALTRAQRRRGEKKLGGAATADANAPRGVKPLMLPLRILVWIVTMPIAIALVAIPARMFDWVTTSTAVDILTTGEFDRFAPLIPVLLAWAVVWAVLAHIACEGFAIFLSRRRRSAPASRGQAAPARPKPAGNRK